MDLHEYKSGDQFVCLTDLHVISDLVLVRKGEQVTLMHSNPEFLELTGPTCMRAGYPSCRMQSSQFVNSFLPLRAAQARGLVP